MQLTETANKRLESALTRCGHRATRQRALVYECLLSRRDHPTADEVYARCKEASPTISLATVYNCLDTLVECGLIKQVNFERESSRYCPNLSEHAHFHCKETGQIVDIELPAQIVQELESLLPTGYVVDSLDLSYRGKCLQNA